MRAPRRARPPALTRRSKHQQRHLKPHRCRFADCARAEGFATPNDRDRHEKSCHRVPGRYWKCLDARCGSFGKEFGRRDNLRDHLRRMHPVPSNMAPDDAGVLRSRMVDSWRFERAE